MSSRLCVATRPFMSRIWPSKSHWTALVSALVVCPSGLSVRCSRTDEVVPIIDGRAAWQNASIRLSYRCSTLRATVHLRLFPSAAL